ncbi:hypothetical protein PG993_000204 [Apiospora rasikravindrae]|uniref:Cytochrome P450 n=1 Tax=Apiospora rasikravindrae TaxID=990691 RepID=A0ABR1U7X2_9PEZI
MLEVIPNVLGGLVALGAFVVMYRVYLSPLRHIPGPGLGAVTRFWYVWRLLKGKINLDILAAHDRYGHFVRIAPNEVSVGHPDGPKKILLATLHKAEWYKIATFPAIDSNITLLLDWLDRFAESGDPIKLGDYLRFATNDIVGDVLFSRPFGFLKKGADIDGCLANNEVQIAYVSVMGFFRWVHVLLLANPVMTWLGIVPWGHTLNAAKKALADRQQNPDGRYDVSAHWFRMLAEDPTGRMQRHEIDSAAFNAISAATDTVAATIQALLYYLMRHPEFRVRVQAEMAAAGIDDSRVVSYADAQGLRFLWACIKESLRLFGPVTMGFPRVSPRGGIMIGDQTFPEGTILSVHPWVIHLSKEVWGENAREFNPDRWFGDDVTRLDKHFIPFSLGYGSCPGQNLGRIELSKICATLIRGYDFRQVEPEQPMQYEAYFGLTAHMPACYCSNRLRHQSTFSCASASFLPTQLPAVVFDARNRPPPQQSDLEGVTVKVVRPAVPDIELPQRGIEPVVIGPVWIAGERHAVGSELLVDVAQHLGGAAGGHEAIVVGDDGLVLAIRISLLVLG